MRHNNKINSLGRKSAHRKAMLSNMATSLIMHKRIKTTLAKAKALRVYIEPIITKSKEDTTHSRRLAFGYLQDKNAVTELFREVSPKIIERPGGYTRILKTGKRLGDAAEMCYIELVDFNESMLASKEAKEAKVSRRSRRGSKKKTGIEGEKKSRPAVAAGKATKPEAETKTNIEGKADIKPEQKNAEATKTENTEPAELKKTEVGSDASEPDEEITPDVKDQDSDTGKTEETKTDNK